MTVSAVELVNGHARSGKRWVSQGVNRAVRRSRTSGRLAARAVHNDFRASPTLHLYLFSSSWDFATIGPKAFSNSLVSASPRALIVMALPSLPSRIIVGMPNTP